MQNPSLQRPPPPPSQSVQEIQQLVQMARHVGPVTPAKANTTGERAHGQWHRGCVAELV
jgi:hypothetical protein